MNEGWRHFTKEELDGKSHTFTYWDESGNVASGGVAQASNARCYYRVDDEQSPVDAGEVSANDLASDATARASIERHIWHHYVARQPREAKNTSPNVHGVEPPRPL